VAQVKRLQPLYFLRKFLVTHEGKSLPAVCRRENIYPVYLSTTLRDTFKFAHIFVGLYRFFCYKIAPEIIYCINKIEVGDQVRWPRLHGQAGRSLRRRVVERCQLCQFLQ